MILYSTSTGECQHMTVLQQNIQQYCLISVTYAVGIRGCLDLGKEINIEDRDHSSCTKSCKNPPLSTPLGYATGMISGRCTQFNAWYSMSNTNSAIQCQQDMSLRHVCLIQCLISPRDVWSNAWYPLEMFAQCLIWAEAIDQSTYLESTDSQQVLIARVASNTEYSEWDGSWCQSLQSQRKRFTINYCVIISRTTCTAILCHNHSAVISHHC